MKELILKMRLDSDCKITGKRNGKLVIRIVGKETPEITYRITEFKDRNYFQYDGINRRGI